MLLWMFMKQYLTQNMFPSFRSACTYTHRSTIERNYYATAITGFTVQSS